MAHAAVVSILEILDQITKQDQSSIFPTNKQQFESLHNNFTFLQSFLENDPQKGEKMTEKTIRDVAYEAQDIIEPHVSNQVSSPQDPVLSPDRTVKIRSWRLLSTIQKVMSLQRSKNVDSSVDPFEKLSQDLHKVVEKAGSIVEDVMKIKKSRKNEDLQSRIYSPRLGSTRASPMVGFDEDLLEIKDQLCGGSSRLQVVSIIGMGGIGKTTLASTIFDDSLISYHFHIRAWMTITQSYHVRDILLSLINSMNPERPNRETEEGLAEFLYKSLKGRKYLIVLDDIWSTQAWDDVKLLFPNDNNGSRIVLTTRLFDVAFYANPFGPFRNLRFLDEDESWNLLRTKVFDKRRCPIELEEIGKLIAKNCRGLPLAIVVVAGLLRKTNTKKNLWENLARDISLAMATNDEHFALNILSLSYNHLPHHLKACFLYIGGFPEDYEIPVFKLVNLWIAEGFLKPIESKCLEDVANEYLEDLVKRSLVLITKQSSSGKFKFCGVHDLLRDLCIHKARDEDFLHVLDGIQETITNKRRISFSRSLEWFHFKNLDTNDSRVRSIFCCLYNVNVTNFSLLRVLDIREIISESFPVEVLKLFHIRYLAFATGFVRYCTLPPSITKLRYLQTLIIDSSVAFRTSDHMLFAPFPIWKMPQLRHLIFLNIILSPVSLENEPRALENLQTLSRVKNFRFNKKAIEMIPNVKKLKVLYTGESRVQRTEYELENLARLDQLETLNLKFHPSSGWWKDPLPVRFELPVRLKILTLSGCGLLWKDTTSIGLLPNLEVLKLRSLSVTGEEWDPVEGGFVNLRFLLMEWLDLKRWHAESVDYPRLERLVIRHCAVLEEIPSGIGEIGTLEMIEVKWSKYAAHSANVILEEQQGLGNDVLQVLVGSHLEHDFW